jgi:hypothetical protein
MKTDTPIFPGQPGQERASGCGFFLFFVVGLASIGWAIRHQVGAESVALELGTGMMLFAFLYWAERRLVRNQAEQLIEALSGDPKDLQPLKDIADRAEDLATREGGPSDIAWQWISAVCSGHYETAWELSEYNWRLCRAQAWLWNNKWIWNNAATAIYGTRDEIATALASSDVRHPLWLPFVQTEEKHFLEVWKDVQPEKWGIASNRRPTGRGYELVVFSPLGRYRHGYLLHAPAYISNLQLLMHKTKDGWLMASVGSVAPPDPGWPPSWWLVGDPALFEESEDPDDDSKVSNST